MEIFPGWKRHIVPQKHPETSCIAWSYEILLRILETEGIDYSTFQDEFDLGRDVNHFGSVADAIRTKYTKADFTYKAFATGERKVRFLEELAAKKIPAAISLPKVALPPPYGASGGYHIVPVPAIYEDEFGLFWGVDDAGTPILFRLTKEVITKIHDKYEGCREVSFPTSRLGDLGTSGD